MSWLTHSLDKYTPVCLIISSLVAVPFAIVIRFQDCYCHGYLWPVGPVACQQAALRRKVGDLFGTRCPLSAVPSLPTAIFRSAAEPEDWSLAALADGQVDRPCRARCERDGHDLAAFARDHQGSVPALDAKGFYVRAGGFGDAQPVEGQQGDQRVLGGRPEPRGDQQRAEFVAVQAGGM